MMWGHFDLIENDTQRSYDFMFGNGRELPDIRYKHKNKNCILNNMYQIAPYLAN